MGHEDIFEKNPVSTAAEEIKRVTSGSVDLLSDAFPRNYQYEFGDYNLVYAVKHGYGEHGNGFFQSADMVILDKNGDYRSGLVNHEVRTYTNHWKFRESDLRPATDLEIIKYAPVLMQNLYQQVLDELEDRQEEDVERMLCFMQTEIDNLTYINGLSQDSYMEMSGGQPLAPEIESSPAEAMFESLAQDSSIFKHAKESQRLNRLERFATAFDIYKRREDIIAEVTEISACMRAVPTTQKLKSLIRQVVISDLFPDNQQSTFEMEDQKWIPARNSTEHIKSSQRGGWVWIASEQGDVLEFNLISGVTRHCPEHLLSDAPRITKMIINLSVKNVLPGLYKPIEKLPF